MVPGFSPTAATAPRDGLIALGIAAMVAGTVLVSHLIPASTQPGVVAPSADATCAEWSDGCQICQRAQEGIACSTPGIACVKGEASCLRRVGS